MKITSKGRYALRVVMDLSENSPSSLMEISTRQGISKKYLEHIAAALNKAGLVTGTRGNNGGYRLIKDPGEITALDVIEAVEGPIAVVSCLEGPVNPCERSNECKTLPVWMGLKKRVKIYLGGVTIKDLIKNEDALLL